MEPVPAIRADTPSKSTVVASERTFGPTMLNTVEPMANVKTMDTSNLNCPMNASILRIDPLKSRAFSPGIMGP